jgi:Fe-S cluster assembly scaffold protein SufB
LRFDYSGYIDEKEKQQINIDDNKSEDYTSKKSPNIVQKETAKDPQKGGANQTPQPPTDTSNDMHTEAPTKSSNIVQKEITKDPGNTNQTKPPTEAPNSLTEYAKKK